ncbi:chemotaxis protein CheW [Clostridium sp. CTA-5]
MSNLLQEIIEDDEDTQKDKYLIFSIDRQDYGIDIENVIEIICIQPITEVPELPDYIKGVINLRGKIIPVMDIRLKLKKEAKKYDDRTCIIIVEIKGICIGFIIDRVLEVATIPEKDLSSLPKIKKNEDNSNKYIRNIAKVENEVRLIIDCNKIIEDDEIEKF